MTRRARSKRAAFTLIEVMMAIAILTVGSVGILAMQQASTRGNMNARQMTTATSVTRNWIERIRRDALNWRNNQAGGTAGTTYLQNVPSDWAAPLDGVNGERVGADWFGRDAVAPNQRYCTHIRLQWVVQNSVARADVRTFWYKRSTGDGSENLFPNCGAAGGEAAVTAELAALNPRVHVVHASTLVRWRQ
ncbi:MAG: prepilin-type N-terminal cleavage/methylation domain-containing protein [Myxococcota bacterium]